MLRVIYKQKDDSSQQLEIPDDAQSVMKAAVNNRVKGIIGECGGVMQCATCHVYVDEDIADSLPPISDQEDEMLEGVATERTEHSRLSCQLFCSTVPVEELTVYVPETQY
ncbi:hypothetical protein DM793_03670 [Paenarthrobacter nitroguajacolicus]|uniref:2Fe-2S iron-sulfur cluster-binding protein n=1 Tax=Paenarthrobacter nitroguajacolicus TaxID=211146 RepID=UPI0015B94695|nr:2Fe-2S iron-sulfur cluster-binding protein [Paenarthrobacter nitroguajacolicus]NWL10402.1 hypothetical protein [Paenarthrobacter nitroguajacolicus]